MSAFEKYMKKIGFYNTNAMIFHTLFVYEFIDHVGVKCGYY